MSFPAFISQESITAIILTENTYFLPQYNTVVHPITKETITKYKVLEKYSVTTPKDRTVTHTRILVDYRPQKDDPNCVCITTGGNLAEYPEELTTRMADLTASRGQSRAAGHFFLGSVPKNNQPSKLNGAIHILCTILKMIAASAAEGE